MSIYVSVHQGQHDGTTHPVPVSQIVFPSLPSGSYADVQRRGFQSLSAPRGPYLLAHPRRSEYQNVTNYQNGQYIGKKRVRSKAS